LTRRREISLVVGFILLGALLRLYQIGAQSLWFDELLSLSIARLPIQQVIFSPASIDPPLFYVLLHFWLRFGTADGIVRLLPAFCGVATIPAIYALGKQLLSAQVGLAAALIFAIAPLQLYHAQEVRMYPQLILLSTLSILAFVRARASARPRDWTLWVGLMALALYTHTFAGLLLVALDANGLVESHWGKRDLSLLVLSNVAIACLLLPWGLLWLQKLQWLLPALWLAPPSIAAPLLTLSLFVFGYTLPALINVVALFIFLLTLVFVLTAGWRAMRSGAVNQGNSVRLLLFVMSIPLVVTWLVSQWHSVYVDRLLLESSPALYLLLAWGIIESDRRSIIRVCAAAGLLLVFIAVFNYYTDLDYARPPLRDVIAYVDAHRASDEIVLHTSDSSFLAGRYYGNPEDHKFLYNSADQWLTPDLMGELQVPFETDADRLTFGQARFWVVVAADHIPDEQLAEKTLFDRKNTLLSQYQIGGIGIYHYAWAAQ
jgi:mannosyltransferase